jgi:hypothetical protein
LVSELSLNTQFIMAELLELRVKLLQNEHSYSCSHLPFFVLLPNFLPDRRVQVLQKAWNLLSDDVKTILQRTESNLDAPNSVDLAPKRPFSAGECALWAQVAWLRFAAQAAAVDSLFEAPSSCCKAAAVAR